MKLLLDERVKHRIIGLAVIISIAAIFTPAIIKKSNQKIDESMSVSVKLPPKPEAPKVALPKEKAMFEKVKVAHIEIPEIPTNKQKTVVQAEPLNGMNPLKQAIEPMSRTAKLEPLKIVAQKPVIVMAAAKTVNKSPKKSSNPIVLKSAKSIMLAGSDHALQSINTSKSMKGLYAVQLATFSKQQNAEILISKLRARGYTANYYKISRAQGAVYKVIVGEGHPIEQAKILQQQLANVMQMKGFVVTTGVS